tara:strand:+ start:3530 stop:4024 length:495 start_codon:yes stop_codon:yes gene_type:complete
MERNEQDDLGSKLLVVGAYRRTAKVIFDGMVEQFGMWSEVPSDTRGYFVKTIDETLQEVFTGKYFAAMILGRSEFLDEPYGVEVAREVRLLDSSLPIAIYSESYGGINDYMGIYGLDTGPKQDEFIEFDSLLRVISWAVMVKNRYDFERGIGAEFNRKFGGPNR